MPFLRKNDPIRKRNAFLKHFVLIIQPFIVASAMTIVWRWLWRKGIHFNPADEAVLMGGVITTLGMAYGILAAAVLNSVWEKYKKVMLCVLENDQRTFLLYRDERMPILLHLFLGSLSTPLLGIIMLFGYKSLLSGVVAVFSVSFVLTLYWIVLAQLEDPMKSAWFAERVPLQWLSDDVESFFRIQPKNSKPGSQSAGILPVASPGSH